MKFLKKRLSNGMVALMEKRDLPVVSLAIANRFGGAYEELKIKGIAHFMEHLLFTGTKTRTHEDISREIEKKGGIVNAFTANEVTAFWFKLPSEHVFSGLNIISDIMLNPKFDKEKFEKEKKVILEEIKMYHDNPQRHVIELLEKNLYANPFGEGVIGNKDSVSALKRDFVVDYFKENYSPENYIAVIVGNCDFEKVCDFLEKNFKKGSKKPKILDIKKINKESVEEREGIDQAHLAFGVHAPLMTDEHYCAFEVLNAYLADGMSSKLFLKIREEKGLAYIVKGGMNAEANYSYYSIYVGTSKEHISEVKKMIVDGFEGVKEITDKEVEEAKERVIGLRKVMSEESVNVMSELIFSELNNGAENYYKHEERIRKVRTEDIRRAAKIGKFSTAAIVPK